MAAAMGERENDLQYGFAKFMEGGKGESRDGSSSVIK